MRKRLREITFDKALKTTLIITSTLALIIYPYETATGVKSGLVTLYETLIPSLFPFMILSSYISNSPFVQSISGKISGVSKRFLKVNSCGIISFLLGILGGYPIGAKALAEFYETGKLNETDVRKLFCWCINPSPAFAITAVGTFMLRNTKSGVIIYISTLLSALCIGICVGFLNKNYQPINHQQESRVDSKHIFINSVATGNSAMLSVCGWVLLFSGISAIIGKAVPNRYAALFLNSITEVTNGCRIATENSLPLPVICAILGFGGLAVIFQVSPYLEKCKVSFKQFLCWRIVNSALSAFFCSQIIRFFPECESVFADFSVGNSTFSVNHSLFTAFMMILMCTVFVFEVDNRKKVC